MGSHSVEIRKRSNTTPPKSSSSSPTSRHFTLSSPPSRFIVPLSRTSKASSPPSRSVVPSQPTSKASMPPFYLSSRSTTPAWHASVEKQNPSKRSSGGWSADGLSPMRSLSSSFQPELFICASKKDREIKSTNLDIVSKNATKSVYERKRSPLTRRNTCEQSKNSAFVEGVQSRVVDQKKWPPMEGGKVSKMAFSKSMNSTGRIERAASLMLQPQEDSPARRSSVCNVLGKSINKLSTEVAQQTAEAAAKVEHSWNYCSNPTSFQMKEEKSLSYAKTSRTLSLPNILLPYSPNDDIVLLSSASQKAPSLSSTRPSSPFFSTNNAKSRIATSFSVNHILDARKGAKNADMEIIHQFRLLYNRELQWRFLNSKAEAVLATQAIAVKNICNNVWNATTELQDFTTMKKIHLESLERERKLEMLLKEQISFLDNWAVLEGDYFVFLSRTIEALKASTLRLPVTSGAMVDVRALKNASSSAIDIMHAMGTKVCKFLYQAEDMNRLVSQLYAVAAKEKEMLDECRVLLSSTAGLQAQVGETLPVEDLKQKFYGRVMGLILTFDTF